MTTKTRPMPKSLEARKAKLQIDIAAQTRATVALREWRERVAEKARKGGE